MYACALYAERRLQDVLQFLLRSCMQFHLICGMASEQIVCMQCGNYLYQNFSRLTPSNGPAPSVGTSVSLPVSDGSFENLSAGQPRDGVYAPGPAPAFPTIALASEANGTVLPSSAAQAPVIAPFGAPGPSFASYSGSSTGGS